MPQLILIRFILVCVAIFAVNPAAFGQTWADKMFTEKEHDFGNVARGSLPEHVFEIENCYEEDMVISYVRSSCGCTKYELDKQVIKMWEKAQLKAKFDTVGFSGRREATLSIGFADPYKAEVRLTVRGNILTDTQVFPSRIDFGSSIPGQSPKYSITVTRRNNPSFRIVDIKSQFNGIRANFTGPNRGPGGEIQYQVEAWLSGEAQPGTIQNELNIIASERVNGQPQELVIPVQITGKINAPLQVSPEVISFANVKPGQTVSRKIVLKADQPFRVVDVICENRGFTANASSEAKPVHFVEIAYVAPQQNFSGCEATLQIVTDFAGQPKTSIKAIVTSEPESTNPGSQDGGNN